MNKLLRSPIAAKHRSSQVGVLPPGTRLFARQLPSNSQASCHVLIMRTPVPMGRDPRLTVRAPCLRGPVIYYWQFASQNCATQPR